MIQFSEKVKQYGMLSAGILIAGAKVGKTQILYTDLVPDVVVGMNGTINIDLDQDGTNDLSLDQYNDYYYYYTRVLASNHPNADVTFIFSSRSHSSQPLIFRGFPVCASCPVNVHI